MSAENAATLTLVMRALVRARARACARMARAPRCRVARASSRADGTRQRPRPRERSVAWDGLEAWRAKPSDARRAWAPVGDGNDARERAEDVSTSWSSAGGCLASRAREVVLEGDPRVKAALAHAAYEAVLRGDIEIVSDAFARGGERMPSRPSRPSRPRLVPPKEVPNPKNSPLGAAAHMMHNVAHIELNAIDLAMDTVARFAPLRDVLPEQFYIDFAHVADDESRHLLWCLQRLEELGASYGDMVAHDVLWEGAEATASDPLARLAVVPCMQEARGLDAGPRLVERLVGHGDSRSAAIIRRISDEEVGHVAVGAAWFRTVCAALADCDDAGSDKIAAATFRGYIRRLAPDALRGPFNADDRARAGIDPSWYSDDESSAVAVERRIEPLNIDAARALRDRLGAVVALERGASESDA